MESKHAYTNKKRGKKEKKKLSQRALQSGTLYTALMELIRAFPSTF